MVVPGEIASLATIAKRLDHHDTAKHDIELVSDEIMTIQRILLQTLCDDGKFDIMSISIICKILNMVFGRCSWGSLTNFFRELEKPPQVIIIVNTIENVLLQDMKAELVRGVISDLLITLSRISAIKSFSFIDQKLSGLIIRILHSELSVDCKCRATTILANLTMQNLGNLTLDNIVSNLDTVSSVIKNTKCNESESMKLLHQECWRFILHLSTHAQSRRFTAGRQDVQRLLLNALLDEGCVDNRLFATAILKKMSCDSEIGGVLIQIENGSIIEILKNKAWFDTDLRTRNASLSTLCTLVESKSSDLAKRQEFVNFFSILAMSNEKIILSEVRIIVQRAFCRLARESSALSKDFSTVVTSLFAIARNNSDARATLLEFASRESHRRALVEQDQVLTHISFLIEDPKLESGQFGSQLLRFLAEHSQSAVFISQHERLFGVLLKMIQFEDYRNRSVPLSCVNTILFITSSLPKDKGEHSESLLKWVSIVPFLINLGRNISSENKSKDEIKKSIIHLTEFALQYDSKFV